MSDAVETPGPRLRREREKQGISLQKAADEMHLDTWVIEALETDTYTRLGPAVYAKGHLRKYAALLGLPAAEIVAGYESLHLGVQQPQAASVRSLVPNSVLQNLSLGKVAAGASALLALVGIAWWQFSQTHQGAAAPAAKSPVTEPPSTEPLPAETAVPYPAAPESPPQAALPGPAAVPPRQGAAPTPASVSVPASSAGAAAAGLAATATAAGAVAEPVAGAGRARLRMSFSADSWVDVRDARGKRMFSGNGRANSVKSLSGEAPLRVYLGFASGVQLEINERTVAIGPQFVNGDVARFEAGADGVLRRDSHAARPRG